jgi:hypothetical protein
MKKSLVRFNTWTRHTQAMTKSIRGQDGIRERLRSVALAIGSESCQKTFLSEDIQGSQCNPQG